MGAHLSSYLEGALYKFLNEWINERTLQSTFNNDFGGALSLMILIGLLSICHYHPI